MYPNHINNFESPSRALAYPVPVSLPFDQTPPCLDLPEVLIPGKIFSFLASLFYGILQPKKLKEKTNASA
jgi:hypothetical protein